MAVLRRGSVSRRLSKSKMFSLRRLSSGITNNGDIGIDSWHGFAIIHSLAVEASKDATRIFRESLPPSLAAEKTKDTHDCVTPFKWNECELGPLLGSGEFSDVYQVKSFCVENHPFKSASEEDTELSIEEADQRLRMKTCEKYRDTNKARYALKHIKPEHLQTHGGRRQYIQAAGDLAMEKELLSSLSHPNIIKLRGITRSGPTGFALIVDRLVETLDQRMMSWRNPPRRRRAGSDLSISMSNLSASFTMSKTKSEPKDEGIDSRLSIAFQIAAAMTYLHSHSVIFRDLKPANIGFDVRGDAKIFDFGLARFCPEDGDPNNDAFTMSGAGSPRYMAPECLSGDAYNMKVDVYSFAIVLWEMLSGSSPYIFAGGKEDLINHVVKENRRPDIDQNWPINIQHMLESSFDADMGNRPEMKHVYSNIREVLLSLRNGDSNALDHEWVTRRRSFASTVG